MMKTSCLRSSALQLAMLASLVLPMTAVAVVRGAYRKFVSRANVALEQALDRLEYGEAPKRGIL